MPGLHRMAVRRARFGRRRGAKAIARKALREVNKIKSNIETKHFIQTQAMSPVFGTETVRHLSAIDSGDSVQQREGNMVSVKSLQIRGTIELTDPSGIFENEIVRIIIFTDKTGEVVRTDLDDVLDVPASLNAVRDPIHMNDFRILMDKTVTFQNLNTNTNSSLRFFSFFKRFKRPIKIKWLNITGTNVEENQFYIAAQVDRTAVANSVEINSRSILKFTDL